MSKKKRMSDDNRNDKGINKREDEFSIEKIFWQEEQYLDALDSDPNAPRPDRVYSRVPLDRNTARAMEFVKANDGLDDVIAAYDRAKQRMEEFRAESIGWKIFAPYAWMFKCELKNALSETETTKPLIKHILFSYKQPLAEFSYISSVMIVLVGALLSAGGYIFGFGLSLTIIYILTGLLLVSLILQLSTSESVVSQTNFSKAFEKIGSAFEENYSKHLELVSKAARLADEIESADIDWQKKLASKYRLHWENNADEKAKLCTLQQLKKLDLEGQKKLKNLMYSVAMADAARDTSAQRLRNKVDLEYREGLDNIRTRNLERLSMVESIGSALVEMYKLLASEGMENNKIRRQIELVNAIRRDIENGNMPKSEDMDDILENIMTPDNPIEFS
jgi:hypothetical protein